MAHGKEALQASRKVSNFGLTTFASKETVLLSTSTLNVLKSPRVSTAAPPAPLTGRATIGRRMARTDRGTESLFSSTAILRPSASFLHDVVPDSTSMTPRPKAPQTLTGFLQTASWFAGSSSMPTQAQRLQQQARTINIPFGQNRGASPRALTVAEQARQPAIGPDGRLPGREVTPRRSERHPGVAYGCCHSLSHSR